MAVAFSKRSEVETRPSDYALAARDVNRRGDALDLTCSNPTSVGLERGLYLEALASLEPSRGVHYSPSARGSWLARTAIGELWAERGVSVAPDRTLLTASTSEAYSLLFKLLCDPGDSVLVPRPSYPLLEHLATFEGVKLAPYRLAYDGRWHIDTASLRSAVNERTRAVITVSPNNPTGSYTSAEELEELAGLELPIIADEVFATYPMSLQPGPSALTLGKRQLVFALDGLSKRVGLPQLKLAWLSVGGPEKLARPALDRLEVLNDTYLSATTQVQACLPDVLNAGAPLHDALLERAQSNLRLLQTRLEGSAASVLHVEGGWSAIVRLPAVVDEDTWLQRLLGQGVLVQPGWLYDFEAGGVYIVLSLISREETMNAGVSLLLQLLDRLA